MIFQTINITIYQVFSLILFVLSKTVQDTYSFQLRANAAVGFRLLQ